MKQAEENVGVDRVGYHNVSIWKRKAAPIHIIQNPKYLWLATGSNEVLKDSIQ